jgi:hypothetical protein
MEKKIQRNKPYIQERGISFEGIREFMQNIMAIMTFQLIKAESILVHTMEIKIVSYTQLLMWYLPVVFKFKVGGRSAGQDVYRVWTCRNSQTEKSRPIQQRLRFVTCSEI